MKTIVYVDGFNLYYSALKYNKFQWLDLEGLCREVLPSNCDIVKVKYFTAQVKDRSIGHGAAGRQQLYLKALQAHSQNIEIIKGHFAVHSKLSPLVTPGQKLDKAEISGRGGQISKWNTDLFQRIKKWVDDPGPRVHIINTEEKGSDVNLAVHIVNDAWKNDYECCAVISNDSDLAEACRIARDERGKKVALITTWTQRPVGKLVKNSTFIRTAKKKAFENNQMPSPIPGTSLHKPAKWN